MEMSWENMTKLFTWAAKQGSDAPLADTAGETLVIDGVITKEDLSALWHLNPNLPRVKPRACAPSRLFTGMRLIAMEERAMVRSGS